MLTHMEARPAYRARSGPSQHERWSRRRTLAFIVLTNGAIWAMLVWSVAVMFQR
jgi:hypothetical protein